MPDNGCKEKTVIEEALILIPDISGFTDFMSEAELEHSQVKVAQLLETIIDNNVLNLEVSKIEGDAILFYAFNNRSSLAEIIQQCESMFLNFHEKLKEFAQSDCQCGSCQTLQNLSLKFILHHGRLGSVMIKNYCKLYGKDLILAHRLLKNPLPLREYLLFTKPFMHQYDPGNFRWSDLMTGQVEVESMGPVDIKYMDLKPLLKQLRPEKKNIFFR